MRTLREALINKNNIKNASVNSLSKYILIPEGEFLYDMSRNYENKAVDDCPYAWVWIIDDKDLVDLEQKFLEYSYKIFEVSSDLVDNERIINVLKKINSLGDFISDGFILIENKTLFDIIKHNKKIYKS